ncbi:hypothetical protein LCGC14_2205050 [marine sediment metagenome]|uniref:Uncharacterized protein n=1 Tax=marine sediment metagenome TaxID=412755 RepID=A0A0F9FSX0_9ZZZZ
MSISRDIITKANPPTENVEVVLQVQLTIDREELESLQSDYDFWSMMADFCPPVEVKSAHMEVAKATTR